MMVVLAAVLLAGVLAFVFALRQKDLPQAPPELPWRHLEDRRAGIYENLRDLQFEYRVGKLSDADYESTKKGLQAELAAVMAEIDRMQAAAPAAVKAPAATNGRKASAPVAAKNICPSCGAKFETALKFCGECGKPMGVKA